MIAMPINDPMQGIITCSAKRLSFTELSGSLHASLTTQASNTLQGIWSKPRNPKLIQKSEPIEWAKMCERLARLCPDGEDDLVTEEFENDHPVA